MFAAPRSRIRLIFLDERLEANCLAQACDLSRMVAREAERIGELVMAVEVLGVDADGLAVSFDCPRPVVCDQQRVAKLVVRIGEFRIKTDSLLEFRKLAGPVAGPAAGEGDLQVGDRVTIRASEPTDPALQQFACFVALAATLEQVHECCPIRRFFRL